MRLPHRQWDIVKVRIRPSDRDEHPAILLSPTEVIAAEGIDTVTVLYGTTKRPASRVRQGQIVLNGADGLEHETLFTILQFYAVPKNTIRKKLGAVAHERLRVLKKMIITIYRLLS
jgi:mRNA-degrading endonuclease toxin of MazEF toxin-antitoxin module